MDQYQKIAKSNLEKLYINLPEDLAQRMGAEEIDGRFMFSAFGKSCQIGPDQILLGQDTAPGVQSVIISLYALSASEDAMVTEPFKAFKDFPNSMPYVGAYASHTEHTLVSYVDEIMSQKDKIVKVFLGKDAPESFGGDFSFVLYPLPKISLCYIFYLPDEDFPASVTCLYSNNANAFLPMDALADVGEYASREIIRLITTCS